MLEDLELLSVEEGWWWGGFVETWTEKDPSSLEKGFT